MLKLMLMFIFLFRSKTVRMVEVGVDSRHGEGHSMGSTEHLPVDGMKVVVGEDVVEVGSQLAFGVCGGNHRREAVEKNEFGMMAVFDCE